MMGSEHKTSLNKILLATLLVIALIMTHYLVGFEKIFDKEMLKMKDTNLRNATTLVTIHDRPFNMPLKGDKYSIFQPSYDMDPNKLTPEVLLAPVQDFLTNFERRVEWVQSITPRDRSDPKMTIKKRAQTMYIEMIRSLVIGMVYGKARLSIKGGPFYVAINYNEEMRMNGMDWPYLADTMTGSARTDNVWQLLNSVFENNIEGDYIETGVWRGGSSIFAKAVLAANGINDRISYVCDSFAGLPPGERNLHRADKKWDEMTMYLGVSDEIVASNFKKYNLLDPNVVFAKGFFNETMPVLAKNIEKLSVMRLDGDMYESTVDVLYHLYDKLSIGGYVIMDDWNGFPSKNACIDFFQVHGIQPTVIAIDALSAYWQKDQEIEIQYWRYEQSNFKAG